MLIYSYTMQMKQRVIVIAVLAYILQSNQVFISAVASSQLIGQYPVTYSISINRARDRNSASIIPSPFAIPIALTFTFASAFPIDSSISVEEHSFTYNQVQNSITVTIADQSHSTEEFNLRITNISNPTVSSASLSARITSSNSPSEDTAAIIMQFISRQMDASAVSWQFVPGTVSTISNLTVELQMSVWKSGMQVLFTFPKYWERQLLKTQEQIIMNAESSTCTPMCNIAQGTYQIRITFNTISPIQNNGKYNTTILFRNILSPPTLQPADNLIISTSQTSSNTIIQIANSVYLSSTISGILPIASASTTSLVGSPIAISLQFTTRNDFSTNDTVLVVLGPSSKLLPTTTFADIQLNSPYIDQYNVSLQSNSTILLSSLTLFGTSNVIQGIINIDGIEPASSNKPRTANTITFYRHSYEYNTASFEFSAHIANLSANITLDNNFAYSNVSWAITINFATNIQAADHIFISLPQTIVVSTCNPQCSSECSCNIMQASLSQSATVLQISGLPANAMELVVAGTGKNPIASGQQIDICSTDMENYTKQCGTAMYPQIQQASLPTQTLTVNIANTVVYALSTYTLLYNLTEYSLQNGFLISYLPQALSLINPSNIICHINGQTACTFPSTSPAIINTTVISSQSIYNITIDNIRNPKSTEPFRVSAKVANIDNQFYYNFSSQYYSASEAYQLLIDTHFELTSQTNCTNSAVNNLTITFTSLPFQLDTQFSLTDTLIYQMTNPKTGAITRYLYPVASSISLQFSIINWYSFESVEYQFVLLTSDQLYKIFRFVYSRQNCQPAYLAINSYEFAGLPQDTGTLSLTFNRVHSTITDYSIQLIFPNEYPEQLYLSIDSSSSITSPAPRKFRITVPPNLQPIAIKIWNFTNIRSSSFFTLSVYDQTQFLVSTNNDTIRYELSDISSCAFPCKLCQDGDGVTTGLCRQCFTSALTTHYIIDTVNEQCVVSCPEGTYIDNVSCRPCPAQCSQCSSLSSCSSCTTNFYFLNNSCLTDCPNTYFPVNTTNSCEKCRHPCANCLSEAICLSCSSGYYLQTNSCVTECSDGYIPVYDTDSHQDICRRCQLPCQSCSSTLNNCITCITGFNLHEQSCVLNCPGQLVGYQQQCIPCDICHTCLNNQPTNCTSCSNQYKLYNHACILDCPTGHYQSINTGSGIGSGSVCLICATQCTLCSASNVCQQCSTGYSLYNDSCLIGCPAAMFSKTGSNGRLICSDCQTDCLQCDNSTFCVSCVRGVPLVNGICVSECPDATYPDGGTCTNCSSNCNKCSSSLSCQQCSISFTLHQGQCTPTCPQSFVQINSTCIQCSSHINHCQQCDPLSCSQCKPSFYLQASAASLSQICTLSCPEGTIAFTTTSTNPINICQACATACTLCQGVFDNCTACETGYYFYDNKCSLNCPETLIIINQQCTNCSAPCRTCTQSITNCLSCQSGFLLANQCYNQCPQQYYQSNATMSCVKCSVGCHQCSQNGCLRCDTGYFVTVNDAGLQLYYSCYQSCPSHLPYVNNQSECVKCSEYCLQCSDSRCLQCEAGYNRYGEECVTLCPSPLLLQNQQCVQEQNTIDVEPENSQPQAQNPPQGTSIPVPFTIILFCMILCCFASKFQNKATLTTMCILGIAAVIAPICNVVYLVTIWTVNTNENVTILLAVLIGSLAINYVANMVHIVFSFATYRRDERFMTYAVRNSCGNWSIFVIVLLTENLSFVLYFCRLFNLNAFKASLFDLTCLIYLNYLWGITLLHNIAAAIIGIIILAQDSTFLLQGIDIFIVNLAVLIAGMMLFRKNAQDWQTIQKHDNASDSYSSKKVIFEQGISHESINVDGETIEEVNGRITNKLIETRHQVANQYDGDEVGEGAVQESSKDVYFEDSDSSEPMKIGQMINMQICAEEMKPGEDRNCVIEQNGVEEQESEEQVIDQVEVLNAEQFVKQDLSHNIFDDSAHAQAYSQSQQVRKLATSLDEGRVSPVSGHHHTSSFNTTNKPDPQNNTKEAHSPEQRSINTSPANKSGKSISSDSLKLKAGMDSQAIDEEQSNQQSNSKQIRLNTFGRQEDSQGITNTLSHDNGMQLDIQAIMEHDNGSRKTLNSHISSKSKLSSYRNSISPTDAKKSSKTPNLFANTHSQKSINSINKRSAKNTISADSHRNRDAKVSEKSSQALPATLQTLPIATKFKSKKKRKQKQPNESNNPTKKSHKNLSANKPKKQPIIYSSRNLSSDRTFVEETTYKIDNPKSLIRQIERKEKLRSHQQSLKNIYLRK